MAQSPMDIVESLFSEVRIRAEETERARNVPTDLIDSFTRAGLFRMCVPAVYGGSEADPRTFLRVIERLGEADASTGWVAMIAVTSSVVAAYLPPEGAAEIYGADPDVITGGVFAPMGRGTPIKGGGHRVSGRWRFGSGVAHCRWVMGGTAADDLPGPAMMFFPSEKVQIIDTWHVAGLKGTGSNDFVVDEIEVPATRRADVIKGMPVVAAPLYAFPVFGLLALGIAAVAMGIARAAIHELVDLAGSKTPQGSRRSLAGRAATQSAVAEAEAQLSSARAYLFETVEMVYAKAESSGAIDAQDRAAIRLSATHATRTSATVVDSMYTIGGGASLYETSPLQRYFRDVHAATQHMMVAAPTLELTGRVLLGLETDTSML